MARVMPYPWSLVTPPSDAGHALDLEDAESSSVLNAESITFFTRATDELVPCLSGLRHSAAALAEQVMPNPLTEAGRRLGILSVLSWPLDKTGLWHVRLGNTDYSIPIRGVLRRATAIEAPAKQNEREVALRDTVDLLAGYFREALALTQDHAFAEFQEFAGQSFVRLRWPAIWERWKRVSTGDEPLMARVVEIAFSHLGGIRDVCERPRRMLVRRRELMPVGRVQELDAACLRNLIRRPGRTLLEKAGSRQEILAVTRRETVDTAENRVIRSFIQLCQHRAHAYERENDRAARHPKVLAVGHLRRSCERFERWSPIAGAGSFVGIPRPNYVLQKDRRYHPLWLQYEKLRKEEAAVDSIWPWGRRLWAEFVRCIVISFLCRQADQPHAAWRPAHELFAYVAAEQQAGVFVPALAISGRFTHSSGERQLFAVHPAHAHLCPGLEELLPRLGSDLAFVLYTASLPLRPLAFLCLHTVLSLDTERDERDGMMRSLSATLERVAQNQPGLAVRGLLLRGEWNHVAVPSSARLGRLDYLSARAGGPFWFHDFPELLSVLLEEVAG